VVTSTWDFALTWRRSGLPSFFTPMVTRPCQRPSPVGAFVVSRPGDRGGLLPCQHDDTDERLLIGQYSRGLPYDLMTFEERDQETPSAPTRSERPCPARAARYPTLGAPQP
jgi:hypothetical protein